MQIIIILLAVFFIALLLIGAYDHSKRENAVHIPIESIAEYKNKTVFLEVEIVDLIEKKRHISTYVAGETVIPYFEYTFTYETAIPDVRVVSNSQIKLGVQKIYADVTEKKSRYILEAF